MRRSQAVVGLPTGEHHGDDGYNREADQGLA